MSEILKQIQKEGRRIKDSLYAKIDEHLNQLDIKFQKRMVAIDRASKVKDEKSEELITKLLAENARFKKTANEKLMSINELNRKIENLERYRDFVNTRLFTEGV